MLGLVTLPQLLHGGTTDICRVTSVGNASGQDGTGGAINTSQL